MHGGSLTNPDEVKDLAHFLRFTCSLNLLEAERTAKAILVIWGISPSTSADRSIKSTAPIPLTERFPEQVDCDNEGNFWAGRQTALGWRWTIDCNPTGAMSDGFTHWLPFNTQWLPAHCLPCHLK